MDFNLSYFLKNKDSLWVSVIFYFLCAFLVALIFSYSVITFKVRLQNQEMNELDNRIATYGMSQKKIYEKKIIDYKKKIDDFGLIINNRKISSNIFSFIEENTLPNIWFSNLNILQSANEIKLSGEAENMETLSNQIQVFERSQDYIKNINILNSQVEPSGKINFILSLSLDPKIFTYQKK